MKDEFKKRIIKENKNLPPHEIKKILKTIYPNITNEDVEKLIISMNNPKKTDKKDIEEYER